jgi:uncharacterized membrane protein (DUF4010 family)
MLPNPIFNLTVQQASFQELLTIMAAALGCGLLVGLERERSKHRDNPNSFAGVRSFAICALMGALCFSFGIAIGLIGAVIIGGITIFSLRYQVDDFGVTTELAFVMTYFIGALCLWHPPFAAGLSVILTIILMMKHSIHGIASQWITENEFRDGLFLLALILVALPLTPNIPLWGTVLNPHIILKLLALILAVQALAHIAKRLLSSRNALILSALASGFVSSTATIASLGMEVRAGRAEPIPNAGAALLSCVATLLQILLIVAGISLSWFKIIILPACAAMTVLVLWALWLMRKTKPSAPIEKPDGRMFSLKEAAIIAITLTLIQAAIYGLSLLLGKAGLIMGTLLASLFEIHAAMAAIVVQGGPENNTLIFALIIGMAAHAIAKSVNAALTGGHQYALAFAPAQILHMLVFIGLLWWMIY